MNRDDFAYLYGAFLMLLWVCLADARPPAAPPVREWVPPAADPFAAGFAAAPRKPAAPVPPGPVTPPSAVVGVNRPPAKITKVCPCSPLCVCGCNDGLPCRCEPPRSTPAAPVLIAPIPGRGLGVVPGPANTPTPRSYAPARALNCGPGG